MDPSPFANHRYINFKGGGDSFTLRQMVVMVMFVVMVAVMVIVVMIVIMAMIKVKMVAMMVAVMSPNIVK